MGKRLDLVGTRFGKLVVVSDEGNNRFGQSAWKCVCDCGGSTVTSGVNLRNNHSRSCGCIRDTELAARRLTHGATSQREPVAFEPEYKIWMSMHARCKKLSDSRYGGRGITVCSNWSGKDGYANFIKDMGSRPDPSMSIDRINNEHGYSPENCRWSTITEQTRNKRNNRVVEFGGRKLVFEDACKAAGLKASTVWMRVNKYGWSVDKALLTPVRGG
jgi:hypothetical protein